METGWAVLVAVDAMFLSPAGRVAVCSVPAPLASTLASLGVARPFVLTVTTLIASLAIESAPAARFATYAFVEGGERGEGGGWREGRGWLVR